MKVHTFEGKAPSMPQLRKLLREADKAGEDFVVFERGEQFGRFQKARNGQWIYAGNGLLRAAWKLDIWLNTNKL